MFWEFIIFSGNSIVDSGEAVEVMEIIPGSDDDKELGTKTAVFLLLLIFCSSLLAMGLVWKTFPDMDEQDQKSLKFPKTLDDAKELGAVLSRYKEQYFAQVSQHFTLYQNLYVTNILLKIRCLLASSAFTSFYKHLQSPDPFSCPSFPGFYFLSLSHYLQFVSVLQQVKQYNWTVNSKS